MVYLESWSFVSPKTCHKKFRRRRLKKPARHFSGNLSPALAGNTDYFGNPFDSSRAVAFSGKPRHHCFLSGWSTGPAADGDRHSNDVFGRDAAGSVQAIMVNDYDRASIRWTRGCLVHRPGP